MKVRGAHRPSGKSLLFIGSDVKSLRIKIFCFRFSENRCIDRSSRLGKRGERVVTIVRRDAMDAKALSDVQCVSVPRRRVVLAPLGWC